MMISDKAIYITRPQVASLANIQKHLIDVWENKYFTNNGQKLRLLEEEIYQKLDTKQKPIIVSNGTIAMHMALKALELPAGEILTTPFSWIATTSAILWERYTPVFVDIHPKTLNINVEQLEERITSKTRAIMAVHVFSNPCDVEKIEALAEKYNLKVIYDAAHAFGVNYRGRSVFDWGDISTTSFHATKVFNTIEGGAVFTKSPDLYEVLYSIRDFGFSRNREIIRVGMNAKMSEIHASIGLSNLQLVDGAIAKRRKICELYQKIIGDKVEYQEFEAESYNYAYMPIMLPTEEQLLKIIDGLQKENVFPRRYFYPSLHELESLYEIQECPVSSDISRRIICLPMYPDLETDIVEKIAEKIVLFLD